MAFKVLAAIVAAALLITFVGPVVIKLKDMALSIVLLIGVVLMLFDAWKSLKSKED